MKFRVLVLVDFLSANAAFVYFDRPFKYLRDFSKQTLTDAMEHISRANSIGQG